MMTDSMMTDSMMTGHGMTTGRKRMPEQKPKAPDAPTPPPWLDSQRIPGQRRWNENGWHTGPAAPRTQVQMRFGAHIYAGPVGAPAEAFVWRYVQDHGIDAPPAAILLDNRLRELSTPIRRDVDAKIVTLRDMDGSRIYRRSLTLLLLAAAKRLFPEAVIAVEHSLPFGAYYCSVNNRPRFSETELAALETEMRRLVEADLPITSQRAPLEEVLQFFQHTGDETKVSLLAHQSKEDLALYTLDQVRNFFHGYMAPSTGYLRWFGLTDYGEGFLLRFPRRQNPVTLEPVQPGSTIEPVFQEYRQWLERIHLTNLGSLNNAVVEGKIPEIILVSEALHERRIASIASQVAASWARTAQRDERIRVVFIAGPSSSGKTTFAKRLGVQLLSNGIRPYALSLDNYFVDRHKTPRDAEGNYDFEALEALNLPLLNQHLAALLAGAEVTLPRYNFKTGRSEVGETVRLADDQVLIIEGIHGLNPALTTAIPDACTLRVYVSVLAHLNIDRHNRVSTSDVRLLRRIARDHQHRGYTASDTIKNWESVRRGEALYIFPFQNNADAIFNSALPYELSVLRGVVEPLLLQIEWDTPAYVEARRLLAFLRWVLPVEADLAPDNSIIREFIGGSILRRYSIA